jgi:FMN phosphatase YigB (HAD superfamily)
MGFESTGDSTLVLRPGRRYVAAVAITTVLFDLGDTVVKLGAFPFDLGPAFEAVLRDGGHQCALAGAELAALVAAETRAASLEAREREVEIAAVIAAAASMDGDACHALADVWGFADVGRIANVAGRPEFLAGLLGRGLRLGIVSNTTTRPELLTAMLVEFGLREYFDVLVYSSEIGTRKPHAAIYESALTALGANPRETLFVGDRLREDVLGPTRLGMTAVLTHEFYRDAHNGEPYAVIQRLDEVVSVLDGLA